MSEHPNATLIKVVWRAIADGDANALTGLLANEVVWRVSGRNAWAGDHVGREAVLSFLADVGERADELRSQLEDVFAGEERAVAVFRMRGRRGELRLDTRVLLLVRIFGGRLVEISSLAMDPYTTDAFLA